MNHARTALCGGRPEMGVPTANVILGKSPYRYQQGNVIVPGQIAGWGMGSFFAELKRRHIYRVAAAYAVVAWVLLQLFNNLTP